MCSTHKVNETVYAILIRFAKLIRGLLVRFGQNLKSGTSLRTHGGVYGREFVNLVMKHHVP